ncbi:ABC1 kinase family protein [Acetobacterium bakii]|uniref:ABC transporter n=2 Tax=Acetobacterium bakii TaxID=52689 RepID=A0A0L6U1E9_9FIRM|nr:lipopolysaccharide core heptose(II) kinase RfaY [Acetobacterium bakii]KNZ42177.1 ABC transporter [Acetobacterium bakii]
MVRKRKKEKPKKTNGKRMKKILSILVKQDITKGLTPEKLRLILEDLGPTFVKVGQILSMRQDVLPREYCKELEKLRTQVKPMAYETVIGVMENEYSRSMADIFLEFNKESLGSASIAQVHAAVLKDGSKVVVKIQRPGIYDVMAQDIVLLQRAVGVLNIASGMGNVVDFRMILDEIWNTAKLEMDFLNEAQNAHRFFKLNQDINYVSCPLIYDEYTTSKVLIMEYIEGIEIDQTEALIAAGYDLKEIGIKFAENFVKQVIDDGFFQADPHPGNIIIRDGQIIWIDLGMMGTLSKRDMGLFRRSVKAIAISDIESLEGVILAMGVHKGPRINHAKLYEDIDMMLQEYGTEDLSNVNIGRVMEEMMRIAGDNHIAMPSGISMLSRGVITIEGVISVVTPEINIVSIMTNHMTGQELKDFDLQKFIETNGRRFLISEDKSIDIPGQISDLLRQTNKGQLKVNLELLGSEEPLGEIDKMVNKIVTCVITAALLISSSFIATTDMTPKILGIPALGVIGYFVAMILGGNLIYSISKKKKQR